jgi:hypothetical protein
MRAGLKEAGSASFVVSHSRARKTAREWGTEHLLLLGFGLAVVVALAGCHSSHIDVAVENRTGAAVRLLEVDYPSASFGSDSLASNATFHYRIKVDGSGPVKVQYTAADGRQAKVEGPALADPQEGTLEIVLLPGGKAEFHPHLSGAVGQQ